MDFPLFLERLFCPGRKAARDRAERLVATIEDEYGVDLRGKGSAATAMEVAAETGTPLPRDVLSMLAPHLDPRDSLHVLPPRGVATWGLMAVLGAAGVGSSISETDAKAVAPRRAVPVPSIYMQRAAQLLYARDHA